MLEIICQNDIRGTLHPFRSDLPLFQVSMIAKRGVHIGAVLGLVQQQQSDSRAGLRTICRASLHSTPIFLPQINATVFSLDRRRVQEGGAKAG